LAKVKVAAANTFSGLRRRDLPPLIEHIVHRGRGYQSSVYVICVEGQRAAVKDFADTPHAFRRWVAPFLVSREIAALAHLQGATGVPKYFGRIDRYAFMMEYIEGTPLADFKEGELAPEVFDKVQRVIDGIHERGVSHGDLKRRSNLLLTPDGEIYLIDFAAAIIGNRPARPFWNWLQKEVARVDDKSVPRLKKFVAPEALTEADLYKLANPTALERWARKLFNR
jgi:predicted Ser/Thr protein kinase